MQIWSAYHPTRMHGSSHECESDVRLRCLDHETNTRHHPQTRQEQIDIQAARRSLGIPRNSRCHEHLCSISSVFVGTENFDTSNLRLSWRNHLLSVMTAEQLQHTFYSRVSLSLSEDE